MRQTFWHRLRCCFPFHRQDTAPEAEDRIPTLAEVQAAMLEEFRGLRKILRKQSQTAEDLRARLAVPAQGCRQAGGGEDLMPLASTFFHLDQSLDDQGERSPQRRQAVALFWIQLEQLLDRADIRMIREQGVPFDPRLHRAVLAQDVGAREQMVTQVLEPGFIEGGRVCKPAKVILGPADHEQQPQEETRS